MATNLKVHINENYKKEERLTLLKERYKKLILEPRKEIESEIEKDVESDCIDNPTVLNHSWSNIIFLITPLNSDGACIDYLFFFLENFFLF